jgi:hypothetical protein
VLFVGQLNLKRFREFPPILKKRKTDKELDGSWEI